MPRWARPTRSASATDARTRSGWRRSGARRDGRRRSSPARHVSAATLALLGDVNLAEPGALIGFAGPRVIEQTIHQKLPRGFQRAEFLLEHGMVDAIVPRAELRTTLARLLDLLAGPAVAPKRRRAR